MKKDECERIIRGLCHVWRQENGFSNTPPSELSFEDFFFWLSANQSACLKFSTTTSVRYDVEMWFDQEFEQTWRR